MTKEEILAEATSTLEWVFATYKERGVTSIYLWGSIITPDFNPKTSDIDAVAFLSDNADFNELNNIRLWLPNKNPNLLRLQINFFYTSELTREKPVRSHLARLSTPEQAVYDFPNWHYVCGRKIDGALFPKVSSEQFLLDQIKVVREREEWAKKPQTVNDMQYYCKSLVWLCWAVQKLHQERSVFSWQTLQEETTPDTLSLVDILIVLKQSNWDKRLLDINMPILINYSSILMKTHCIR